MRALGYKPVKGAVLVIVLIFCMLVGLFAKSTIEISILQVKMVNNFQSFQKNKTAAEQQLSKDEQQLEQSTNFIPKNATFLQFVPDTLAYDDNQGRYFYQLYVNRQNDDGASVTISSTFSVRKMDETENSTVVETEQLQNIKEIFKAQSLYDAKFIRLGTGERVLLIAYLAPNHHTHIALFNAYDASILRRFTLNAKLTTKLLVVDSYRKGSADSVYMGNDNGDIVQLDLSSTFSESWDIKYYKGLFQGNMVGTPIAGRHPHAKGLLLYILAHHQGSYALHALECSSMGFKHYFSIKQFQQIGQPRLWQGFLLAGINDDQLAIFDAFTGTLQQKINLQRRETFTVPQEEFMPPLVLVTQPLDKKPIVIVSTTYQTKHGEAAILASRLGRRTWQLMK